MLSFSVRTFSMPSAMGFLFFVLLLPVSLDSQLYAQQPTVWQSLPEETAVAVRIADGKAFADAFRENTKLGTVMFSERRISAIAKAMEEAESEDWLKIQKEMSELGFTVDDLWQLLVGETGYALVIVDDENHIPRPLGLAWCEPGAELAGRTFEILGKVVERQEDQEHPATRIDLELADRPVMQLMVPEFEWKYDEDYDLPENYSELSEEDQQVQWEQAYEKWRNSAKLKATYAMVLVSAVDNRLLVAHTYHNSPTADEHPDAELLADVFARLIGSLSEGEGGFLQQLADDSGTAEVLNLDGIGMFEALGNPTPLLRLAQVSSKDNEKFEKLMRISGAHGLGPFAWKATLQGFQLHSRYSLATAQPRQGLMKWLDQKPISVDPPDWVPATVLEYSQISFDLREAYLTLKEILLLEFPDRAGQWIAMAEAQVVGFAKCSLEDLLGSVGTRHIILKFEPEWDPEIDADWEQPERNAMVWQLEDEQVWSQLFQSLVPFVSSMPGGKFTEEQGFRGFRFKTGPVEGGLFLGKGTLVLGYGAQVVEKVLSSLNNPALNASGFRGGSVYQQANELLPHEPCWATRVADGNRYAKVLRNWGDQRLDQMLDTSAHDDEEETEEEEASTKSQPWELLRALLPSEEESQGLMGVSVDRLEVRPQGLFYESVQEFPAP